MSSVDKIVYVLFQIYGSFDQPEILGIYSDRLKAQSTLKVLNMKNPFKGYHIEEHIIE